MDKVQLGLIGLGSMGKIHLLNCLKLENAELVAVSDASKKALSFAKKIGIKTVFDDYRELLKEPSLDAVIIALPTHLHAECAINAAEAGKSILLEKPLGRNLSEGKEIISAIRKRNVKLMVGYPLRFASVFRDLKSKILSNELGDVQIANATNVGPGPFFHRAEVHAPRPVPKWWFSSELTGGGALLDLGVHMINLFRWYFGEISDVKSYLGHRFNLEMEDHATCMLKSKLGQIGIINVGWFSQEFRLRVELLGTVGHASAPNDPPSKMRKAIQLLIRKPSELNTQFFNEVQYFVHCVINDLKPSPSGEDGLKDLEVVTQAYNNQIFLD